MGEIILRHFVHEVIEAGFAQRLAANGSGEGTDGIRADVAQGQQVDGVNAHASISKRYS